MLSLDKARALQRALNTSAGATLAILAQKKTHYANLCAAVHAQHFPVSFDMPGGIGKPARDALGKIASFATQRCTTAFN